MTKKVAKNPQAKKDDNIKISVVYGVDIPEKEMKDLIRKECASKIKDFSRSFKECISRIDKGNPLSKESKMYFSELDGVFAAAADVLSVIENTWNGICKELSKASKADKAVKALPCTKKPEKKPVSAKLAKKPVKAADGGLTNAEKEQVKKLRKGGMPIKAIGKAIHRGEKVVSAYVHSLEPKAAKKK